MHMYTHMYIILYNVHTSIIGKEGTMNAYTALAVMHLS